MIRPNIFLFLSLAFVAYATPSGHLMSGTVLDYWEVLNATVQGRLHASVPFSRSCFKKASVGVLGRFDEAACSAVQAEYANSSKLVIDVIGLYKKLTLSRFEGQLSWRIPRSQSTRFLLVQ